MKNAMMKSQKYIASSLIVAFLLSSNAVGAPLRMDANMGGATAANGSGAAKEPPVEYIVDGKPVTGGATNAGGVTAAGGDGNMMGTASTGTAMPQDPPYRKRPADTFGVSTGSPLLVNGAYDSVLPAENSEDEIVLYAGEARVLDVGTIDRVAIGNGKIASTAVIDETKLLIIAQEVGLTNILIWQKPKLSREIRLRVTALNVLKQQQDISEALAGMPNVKVVRRGERLYVEGSISSRAEYATIYALTQQYANLVNNVKLDIQGIPAEKQETQMLIFDLYFVEFRKGYLESLGVSWAKSFNGFNVGVFGEAVGGRLHLRPFSEDGPDIEDFPKERQLGLSTAFNTIISVPGIIKLAVDSGDAFVLASPSIAAKNGGEARFVSGGEVPIPTVSQNGTNVTFKPYGVLIEIAPKMDRFGNITGLLKAEVSNIDPSVSVNGIPGFSTRRTESDFSVKTGEAIVLSGLYSQEGSKDVEKVPLLGDVPVFGRLFSSTNERRLQTEVYMIAIPRTHEGEQSENSESLKSLNNRLNKAREHVGMERQEQMPSLIRNVRNTPQ